MAVACGTAMAQEKGEIYGHVTDSETGELLAGANVVVEESDGSRTTSSGGSFRLELGPGAYDIIWSYMGYQTRIEKVEVSVDEDVQLNVSLTPSSIVMDDLLVQAPAVERSEDHAGRVSVPLAYLNDSASMLHSDVFRAIQLMPGVMASSDFSSGLHIRGGSPDQTLILVDGVTVYNPTHFYGFFSTFNPDVVDHVTLHKGTFPASYGGRLGSVVDVRSKRGNPDHTQGSVSLGLLSSRARVQGPHTKGSYLVAFRRSTLEPTLSVLRKTEESIPDRFHFYDLNASVHVDAGRDDKLDFSLYNSMDNLEFPVSEIQDFRLNYGNQTGAAKWTHIYSDRLFSKVSISGSRYSNSPAFNYSGISLSKENRVADYSGKADFEWMPGQGSKLMAGAGAGYLDFSLDEFDDTSRLFSSSIRGAYATGYLQGSRRIANRWQVNAGARGNWYSKGDYFRLEPRLSVNYDITQASTLQAAAGRYYQFASLITSESLSGFDIWLSTADNVPPSYSNQYSLGYKTEFKQRYRFEVDGYYRTMHDLFTLDPFGGSPAGMDYEDLFNYEEGFATGLEFLLSKYTGRLSGFISYTLGTTQKRSPSVNDNRYYPPKYDRLHALNVISKLELSDSWQLSAVFSYGSGQPYTRPLTRHVLNDELGLAPENLIMVDRVNAARLPDYHRLDLGITRYDTFFGGIQSELKLEVINVYSRRNVWFYTYQFPENSTDRSTVSMLPVIPSVTYSISF